HSYAYPPARREVMSHSVASGGTITGGPWDLAPRSAHESHSPHCHMRIIAAHRKDVHGLAFAPDGRTLASVGGQSAAVWVWDARTGELIRKLPGHRDRGRAVALSPDGKLVAAADDCNLVRVWRLSDGVPVAEIG